MNFVCWCLFGIRLVVAQGFRMLKSTLSRRLSMNFVCWCLFGIRLVVAQGFRMLKSTLSRRLYTSLALKARTSPALYVSSFESERRVPEGTKVRTFSASKAGGSTYSFAFESLEPRLIGCYIFFIREVYAS